MLEVGMPVYHSRETLPKALDSLVAQTKTNFITCLSIDGDGEDYSDIIEEYSKRGLHFRIINSAENGGPGIARQRIIDTTQADYIMFLDSDDMLLPRATEILYTECKAHGYNIMRSQFIHEDNRTQDNLLGTHGSITWNHGKCYKVSYLKENDIRFLDDLKTDEDAYFNLVAWNAATDRGETSEVTYLWRSNKNSLTRSEGEIGFFKKDYFNYVYSQVRGMDKIYQLKGTIPPELVGKTVSTIYQYHMLTRYYQLDEAPFLERLELLKGFDWFQEIINDAAFWIYVLDDLKPGRLITKEIMIFYKQPFDAWMKEFLQDESYCS